MSEHFSDTDFFRSMVDHSPNMIYRISIPHGQYEYVSSASTKITGYSPQDFYNSPFFLKEIMHPLYQTDYHDKLATIIDGECPYCEYPILDNNKNIRWLHQENHLIKDDNGAVIALDGIIKDITPLKESQKQKKEFEEKYRLITDNIGDVVWIADIKSGQFKYVSPSVYHLRGYTSEEVLEQSIGEVMTSQSFNFIQERLTYVAKELQSGKNAEIVNVSEVDQICKDGSIVPTEVVTTLLTDENGNFSEVLGVSRNISLRKKAENELRENEEKYRSLYNSMGEGLVISKLIPGNEKNSYIITDINPSFEKMFILKKEEILGRSLNEIIALEKGPVRNIFKGDIPLERPQTFEFYSNHLHKYFFISVFSPQNDEIVTLFEDITSIKLAEEDLKKHAQNIEILNQIITIANKATSMDYLLKNVLNATVKLLNLSYGNIFLINEEKRTAEEVYGVNIPEKVKKQYKAVPIDEEPYKSVFVDGKTFISSNFSKTHPQLSKKHECLSIVRIPLFSKNKIIGALTLSSTQSHSFSSNEKNILESIGKELGTAITRIRGEERIRQSLDEKNLLLREIHHRVKNNMQIVSSLLNLQSHQLSPTDEASEIFLESKNRIKSMAIVHEMLYSSDDLAKINLEKYIKPLSLHIAHSYYLDHDLIKLVMNIEALQINIDTAIPLGLIITELLTNSIKYAFPENRKGTISLNLNSQDDKITLEMSDDGMGLPKNINLNKSKTLGLKLVNGLVNQLNGTLQYDNSCGSKFTIQFCELEYEDRI